MLIIPFFIHHQGCPHRCLFCNQLGITGPTQGGAKDPAADLQRTVDEWLDRSPSHEEVQVAFFGGSFTCLDEALQNHLLQTVAPYIDEGRVDSVRLSTRPDCVTESVCDLLTASGVRTVEIGAQSMNDQVLESAGRGHTAQDVEGAARLLAARGLQVGIQLMAGLPGETTRSFMDGVKRVADLGPELVRLYPTLVLKDTGLAQLFHRSSWKPLCLARAVSLVGRARQLLLDRNIKVIRMGLQPSSDLEKQLIAGPYHPAFGELVISRSWYLKVRPLLRAAGPGRTVRLVVSDRDYSALAGLKKQNLRRLQRLDHDARLLVERDPALARGHYHHRLV